MSKQPPIAPKKPKTLITHDQARTDNYYWLREKESEEVLNYLKAENEYMEGETAHTKKLQNN